VAKRFPSKEEIAGSIPAEAFLFFLIINHNNHQNLLVAFHF